MAESAKTTQVPASSGAKSTAAVALTQRLAALEDDLQMLDYVRRAEIRHRGLSNLMADKLQTLRTRSYPASQLFRILVLGDSVVTAIDGVTPSGEKNPAAESKFGFHQAPPHLEWRNLAAQVYERLAAQKYAGVQNWQGDIEFRRFSHPSFIYTGSWTSNPLIERVYPEYEKAGFPRFFDFCSPARNGDAMEIAVSGKRYLNVVYAKRFVSGRFTIEVDGAIHREINCAEGLASDIRVQPNCPIYSVNDVVDCREMIDLGDAGRHTLRFVASDVSKPVRIWGVEMWNTPSFVVMNGGKSGLNMSQLEVLMRVTGRFMKPDIILAEANGNDDPKNVISSMRAYSSIIRICMKAHVPVLFSIPCLYPYSDTWRSTMNAARTVLRDCRLPYMDVQKKLALLEQTTDKPMTDYAQGDGHLRLPGIELYAEELVLPFLNDDAVQDDRFAGDTDWR